MSCPHRGRRKIHAAALHLASVCHSDRECHVMLISFMYIFFLNMRQEKSMTWLKSFQMLRTFLFLLPRPPRNESIVTKFLPYNIVKLNTVAHLYYFFSLKFVIFLHLRQEIGMVWLMQSENRRTCNVARQNVFFVSFGPPDMTLTLFTDIILLYNTARVNIKGEIYLVKNIISF